MSLWSDAENAAGQTTNEADTVPVISLATVLPVTPTVPAALSLELVNDTPLTRMLLKQVLSDLSERLYRSFRRQVRLVVHGGAVMVLHLHFSHRESTLDVNYIHRPFVKEYHALGFMDAEQRLRECIAKTAYRFNLGADWMNDHADVALPWALECVSNHSIFTLPIGQTDFIFLCYNKTPIQPTGLQVRPHLLRGNTTSKRRAPENLQRAWTRPRRRDVAVGDGTKARTILQERP